MSVQTTTKTPPIKPLLRKIGVIAFAVLFAIVFTVLVVENVKDGTSSAKTGSNVADKVAETFAVDTGTIVVSSISFSPSGAPQLEVPYPLNAKVYPSNATDPTLIWRSSNTEVATVDQEGVVTFHQYAGVTIAAHSVMSTDVVQRVWLTCAPPPNDFVVDLPAEVALYGTLAPTCYPLADGQVDLSKPSAFSWCSWEWDEEYFYYGDYGFSALKAGTTTLVASRDGYRHEYAITVTDSPFVYPTGLKVNVDYAGNSVSTSLRYLSYYTVQLTAAEGSTFFPLYRSLDPDVLTVNEAGSAHGIAEGTARVEVTNLFDPEFSYIITFTVRQVAPTAIAVIGPEKAGRDATTRYYVQASGHYTTGGDKVTWTTSDPKIATIDEDGRVTVHRFGKVTVTATSVLDPTLSGSYQVKCVLIGNFTKWVRKILGHFMGNAALGFATLGLLWFAVRRRRYLIAPAALVIGVTTSLFGEFLQLSDFTSGRYGSFEDALINFSGFVLGAIVCAVILLVAHLIRRARWRKAEPLSPAPAE